MEYTSHSECICDFNNCKEPANHPLQIYQLTETRSEKPLYMLGTYFKNLVDGRTSKIISAMESVFFFIVLAIIAGTPSANGYEISIYDVYPWYFWLIISILLSSSLIAIILENMTGHIKFSYLNLIVFFAFLSIIMLITLPAFRGYPFFGKGDIYSHLGLIKDISLTGHFGITNPYPAIHILINILASISSCSPETISLYITQVLFTIYVTFIFLLTVVLKCNRIESLSITSFAILPALGYWLIAEHIMPSTDAFFLIPLVLFCVIKARLADNKFPYSVLSVLLLVLFPFLHVESTIFLFIALIILSFSFKITEINNNSFIPAIILLVGCVTWFSSTLAFSGSIRSIYNALILGLDPVTPPLEAVTIGFRVGIIDAINGIIRIYGPALVYLGIGGSLSLFKIIKTRSKNNVLFLDIFLSTLLSIYAFLHLVFLSKGTNIGFHIFRQVKYSIMVSTFIIGLFFAGKLITENHKTVRKFFLIISIFLLSILMVYNIYPSASSYSVNYQPTYSDIAGMDFFFNYRNDNILILETIGRAYQTRWSDKIDINNKSAIRYGYSKDVRPPNHFGYDNAHLGDFYIDDQYLLTYPPCEIYYPTIYPNNQELWDFTLKDFKLLNKDPTVNIIYSNYALKIMLVHPN